CNGGRNRNPPALAVGSVKKKSVVLDDKNVIFFEKMSYLLRKCHVFRKNVILHVIKRYAMLYLQKKENRRDSR
ncbi:hypothetical protein, partial [Fusicatenibacter saccharivorans]|uniref:hypothetical protein n=1 Tax=Fusicatenibacter saccharivorans TaxID=1150298 RepID=UPI001A9BE731